MYYVMTTSDIEIYSPRACIFSNLPLSKVLLFKSGVYVFNTHFAQNGVINKNFELISPKGFVFLLPYQPLSQ